MATFHPPIADLDRLAVPLDDAQHQVARALSVLDDGWTVYVRPSVGLERPDFLALHDRHGVCAVVTRDWTDLTHRFTNAGIVERDESGAWRPVVHPRFVAARQRRWIFDRSFALPGDAVEPSDVVRAVVVLPGLTDAGAAELLCRHACPPAERQIAVWGGDALRSRVEEIVGGADGGARPDPLNMARLRANVTVAGRRREPGRRIVLTPAQAELAENPRAVRVRRARGPAGSGKSLGLAARAATLAEAGRQVLVVCFSVTNAERLRRLVDDRCLEAGADPTLVTCANFHSFCERVVDDGRGSGIESVAKPGMRLPDSIVANAMHVLGAGFERRFDAVLVDEGHDFSPGWWNVLRSHVVERDGELLLVADPLQDLYDRRAWLADDPMAAAGFLDPWIELTGSLRMPADVTEVANEFAHRNVFGDPLPSDVFGQGIDVPGPPVPTASTVGRWENVQGNVGRAIGREVVRLLEQHPDLAPGDVVFLCEHHHDGEDAAAEIEAAGHRVHHLFSRDPDAPRRNRRYRLWPEADAVVGCTVHSFKGCGARAVVFGIGTETRTKRSAFVSLTRVAADPAGGPSYVSIVNADRRVDDFEQVVDALCGVEEIAPPGLLGWGPPRAEHRVC